jgi:hypothetical protein
LLCEKGDFCQNSPFTKPSFFPKTGPDQYAATSKPKNLQNKYILLHTYIQCMSQFDPRCPACKRVVRYRRKTNDWACTKCPCVTPDAEMQLKMKPAEDPQNSAKTIFPNTDPTDEVKDIPRFENR